MNVLNALKSILFYPMMWLRGVFLLVGKILQGFFLLGLILVLFIAQGQEYFWTLVLMFAGGSFSFFLLTHFYDQILLRLNPTGKDLILVQ
ncbi:hypothetical protein CR163_008835 [Prosthecochloris sp. ZM_2]|uniref:hypothetical protein n=1 Tax=Prosthecochloris sp. ZM_2 TaxID=2045206 RepID=UPI000DF7BB9E|nr:hypothetical protein [Prosthecochloris sp. ZM_2]RNA65314.1 hypothetical protein CR163_008835 [Prosthecochloris sp. ZM_2]